MGKDDRSDIAALHHDVIMRGDTALLLHEGRAHLGDGRHRADGLVDLWRANRSRYVDAIEGDGAGNGIARLVREDDGNFARDGLECSGIVKTDAVLDGIEGDAAVHGTRVKIMKAEHACDALGNG